MLSAAGGRRGQARVKADWTSSFWLHSVSSRFGNYRETQCACALWLNVPALLRQRGVVGRARLQELAGWAPQPACWRPWPAAACLRVQGGGGKGMFARLGS